MARKSRRNMSRTDEAAIRGAKQEACPTAIYVRLSVENLGKDDDGAAIGNQKDICREYVSQHPDLRLVKVYEDNGWSGTVMHRPAFDELMEDVRNGIIKAIVVRDLSRFARNYIEAGTYLERTFPELGVRFISVKERLDTLTANDAMDSLVVPLQNLVNDLYAKDISRKVETTLAIQMKEGTFRWRAVPYGYRKNEERTNIVPDKLRADVVRQIFVWKADGVPLKEIARRLNAAKAPKADVAFSRKAPWVGFTVRRILRNPAYIGIRILGKQHSAIYKGIKHEMTTPDHWHIFPDAHEPLVERDMFDKVQDMLDRDTAKRKESVRKTAQSRAKLRDLFEGKIFCADCGHRMYFHRCRPQAERWYGRYMCSSYHLHRAGTDCRSHIIYRIKLEGKVLAIIQDHIRVALDYEKLIASFRGSERDKENRNTLNAAIRTASRKVDAVQQKRKRLYEDYVEGILNAEEYAFAKKAYEEEYETWSRQTEELTEQRDSYQKAVSTRNPWVTAMRSLKNAKKLSQELVDATIDRIYVHEGGDIHVVMKYQDIFELTRECLGGEPDA